jgi:diaminopimelate decarboxylase
LEAARDAGVGRIVIDSLDEMDRIREAGLRTKTLIRVTPGIEADTHRFIQTGQADSKFGFTLMDDVALDAIERALGIPGCPLVGVHAHIGSQIADLESFDHLASRLAELLARAEERFGFRPTELNLGGGFAIAYVAEERPPRPEEVVSRIKASVDRAFTQREIEVPRLFIEPGRSLIGPAGVSIYSVGTVKHVPSQDGGSERRTFVSVDGGMGDNIRPALYGARYCAILASRSSQRNSRTASVVGKYCESGDFLIEQVDLPEDVGPGDLLAVPATGAYTYSMAGNYNRNPRPAVVLVEEGTSRVMIERETHDDLLRHDRTLNAGI